VGFDRRLVLKILQRRGERRCASVAAREIAAEFDQFSCSPPATV
jgi:hypothetical protein